MVKLYIQGKFVLVGSHDTKQKATDVCEKLRGSFDKLQGTQSSKREPDVNMVRFVAKPVSPNVKLSHRSLRLPTPG